MTHEHLDEIAPRRFAVLDPLKLVIENYPEGQVEEMDAVNHPGDPSAGTRKVPFSREIYIEAEDFMEVPEKGFFRLSPGKEVRLQGVAGRAADSPRANAFLLRDGSGEILVVAAGALPPENAEVALRGVVRMTVTQGVRWTLDVRVDEMERLR